MKRNEFRPTVRHVKRNSFRHHQQPEATDGMKRNEFRPTAKCGKIVNQNLIPACGAPMTEFYRRKLPHWQPEGAMYFITFRLADSLPGHVIQELVVQREREKQSTCPNFGGARQRQGLYELDKKYFGQLDSWLDRCIATSPRWLAEERIARIVADELHALDGERYLLIAYSLMPNHVHIVLDTADYKFQPSHQGVTAAYPLTDTLKRLKGRTARFCNQALGRSGAFWHSESYDHVIRDMHECERIVGYVLNNPVKAGLVERWEDWKFSFCRPEFIPVALGLG